MDVTLELPPKELWADFWKHIAKQGISGLYKFPIWKQIRDGWAIILLGEQKADDLITLTQTTKKLMPFEIAQVMYYNPSAPSLYINLGEGNIFTLRCHTKTGREIWEQMKYTVEEHLNRRDVTAPVYLGEDQFTNFLETSVRTLVILKLDDDENQYNAINYRVVLP